MPYIVRQLRKAGVVRKLGRICLDFLRDRKVSSGRVEKDMEKGCLQESGLRPILWNVVMKGWVEAIIKKFLIVDEQHLI